MSDLYNELTDIEFDLDLPNARAEQEASGMWTVVLGTTGVRLTNLNDRDARNLVTLFKAQTRIIQEASKNVQGIADLLAGKKRA